MDEDGDLQRLGKELVELFHEVFIKQLLVPRHDPGDGCPHQAGQHHQYHQGAQRIVAGMIGVFALPAGLQVAAQAGRSRKPLGKSGVVGADQSPQDAQHQQSGQGVPDIAVITSAFLQDEQVEHAQQDGGPVKHPDQGIPDPDGLAASHRFLHDVFLS
ncbi:hypothetical protein D3C77_492450 [compost metagenome]